MSNVSNSTDKTLKAVPTVTSYLNNYLFGSNNPDWILF